MPALATAPAAAPTPMPAPVAAKTKRAPAPMNGVDTPALEAARGVFAAQPDLAKFRFRARSRWVAGAQVQSVIGGFFGAGSEQRHKASYFADADHPAVLCGGDAGPTPVEWVLHALAACLAAGIATLAAQRGIKLSRVEAAAEGNIDLRGTLGLAGTVRNGYQNLRIAFTIEGDATAEEIDALVAEAKARSAVYDIVAQGVPVAVTVG